jgi:serine protease AprX
MGFLHDTPAEARTRVGRVSGSTRALGCDMVGLSKGRFRNLEKLAFAKGKNMDTDNTPKQPAAASPTLAEHREVIRLDMMRSIVTEPLLSKVNAAATVDKNTAESFDVIISLNELFPGGGPGAMRWVVRRAQEWNVTYMELPPYLFACLTAAQIISLAEEARQLIDTGGPSASVVYRIWEDQSIATTLTKSVSTVKADAAQRAFQALGDGIVWAVLDSGIQGDHPHFAKTQPQFSSDVLQPVVHLDFTPDGRASNPPQKPEDLPKSHPSALLDRFGHGSHVAGIIAGSWCSSNPDGELVVGTEMRDELTYNPVIQRGEKLKSISGVAPKAQLVSLKVIADVPGSGGVKQTPGQGKVSWLLMAIDQIQQWNLYGKRLLVHGVNMSLGYDFDPRWFACGQSPLCVEVNRLVRSGVAVVVSAGNGGYAAIVTASGVPESRYSEMNITDPGNADLAITVGSTHREMPHTYGVSYFSSRGPTGDGRLKPDIIAPGERIISCAAGLEKQRYTGSDATAKSLPPVLYCEQTGTSMAAPHVSGAIAAFLSVRREFIGEPEKVKAVFLDNAVDLNRQRNFQGAGLLDLMKVLQAV